MTIIAANGIAMEYRLEGPADAPVLMLSNSLLTDYRMWDLQAPAFAAHYCLLRYDTRGHGGSAATAGAYSMQLLAADALALLDALGLARVHFLGLSMGGMIGQYLASRHPDRVRSLVLSDTACHMPPAAIWDERIALAEAKGTAAFIGPMTERWLTADYRERHPEMLRKIGTMIARTSVEGLVGCSEAIKRMDHRALLGDIAAPTLVVVGEQDPGTPIAAARTLHEGIKGSKLAIIPDAAHLPNIQQPEVFDRIVLEFLANGG